jgi:hypothetical protein
MKKPTPEISSTKNILKPSSLNDKSRLIDLTHSYDSVTYPISITFPSLDIAHTNIPIGTILSIVPTPFGKYLCSGTESNAAINPVSITYITLLANCKFYKQITIASLTKIVNIVCVIANLTAVGFELFRITSIC